MAGDWIKMRNCLLKAPQVIRLASELKVSKYEAIGGLFWLWVIADESSLDGVIKLGAKHLDSELGLQGFSQALEGVGWLEVIDENSIRLSNYGEHNGKTGKRRAEDYKRARDSRESIKQKKKQQLKNTNGESNGTSIDPNADKMRTQCGHIVDDILLEKELELEQEKELEIHNTGDKNLTVESDMAEDLARVWIFQRRGVCASEQPGKVLEHFREALKHGLDYGVAIKAIIDPSRKRSEYLWQFMQRLESKPNVNSLEKALERMVNDPTKAFGLGVAFNGKE